MNCSCSNFTVGHLTPLCMSSTQIHTVMVALPREQSALILMLRIPHTKASPSHPTWPKRSPCALAKTLHRQEQGLLRALLQYCRGERHNPLSAPPASLATPLRFWTTLHFLVLLYIGGWSSEEFGGRGRACARCIALSLSKGGFGQYFPLQGG